VILESDSQALITIDYKIDSNLSNEFEQRELELGRTLKSGGISRSTISRSPLALDTCTERIFFL